jgi:hypothetical protein
MKIFDYFKWHYWVTNSKSFSLFEKILFVWKRRVINIEYWIRRIVVFVKTFCMKSLCCHLNINRNDIINELLRPRSQYEYVTSSHLIVALNQASLLDSLNNSSVNRISRFIDHAQTFSERIEKWARDLRRKFYWTIHEEIHFMIFTSRSENDIKTTSKRIEIDIEAFYLVNRRIQIDLDVS